MTCQDAPEPGEHVLCGLPLHVHYIRFPYKDCNEQYWAELTPEEKEKVINDAREYLRHRGSIAP